MERVEWLDFAVFREIERVQAVSPFDGASPPFVRLNNVLDDSAK